MFKNVEVYNPSTGVAEIQFRIDSKKAKINAGFDYHFLAKESGIIVSESRFSSIKPKSGNMASISFKTNDYRKLKSDIFAALTTGTGQVKSSFLGAFKHSDPTGNKAQELLDRLKALGPSN